MFGELFSFDAVTSNFSFGFAIELPNPVEPDVDVSFGEIDVTLPPIIDIIETNAAPVAQDDSATTDEGQAVTVNVTENDSDSDGDTLTLLAASGAANGSLELEDGAVVYTPDEGFSGTDSFTYTIFDGFDFSEATVDVTVEAEQEANGSGGDKSGFTLGQVNDWYNPAWGGGFNVTYDYTINDASIIGEDLSAWAIDSGYTGPGEVVHVWVNGFNGSTVRSDDGSFDIGNVGVGFQPDLQVGDTFSVSFQVIGAGFDEGEHFCPTFFDLDPEEFEAAASDVAITAAPTNDWGSGFLQTVEIQNVSGEEIEGWSVVLDVPEGDTFEFNNVWGATAETLDNGDILFSNLDWNEDINPGNTVNFGFTGDNTTDAAVAIDEFDFTWLG